MRRFAPVACVLAAAIPLVGSCSKASSPTTSAPVPAPTPTPPPQTAPTPTSSRVVEQGCTQGQGTAAANCSRQSSLFLADLDAAIEQLIREHPEYFNLGEKRGDGGFRILQRDSYTAAVIEILGGQGICAALDMYRDFFLLKRGDDASEQFEIEGPSGFIRRGAASYWTSCRPAAFPLEATAVVVKMWVGLYGFSCDEKGQAPAAPEKSLPLSCDGYVTATPKDKDLRTVPPSAHGPDIAWFVRNGSDRIRLLDWNQPFNKRVVPLVAGEFSICATVLEVTGCFNGEVVPSRP
jgi:hypothetical protein